MPPGGRDVPVGRAARELVIVRKGDRIVEKARDGHGQKLLRELPGKCEETS